LCSPIALALRWWALVRAGLPVIRWHHLRHLHGALLLASGVDLATVSHLLGHSSVALTASTYAGVLPSLREDAADQLERFLSQPG
jgi:integrase